MDSRRRSVSTAASATEVDLLWRSPSPPVEGIYPGEGPVPIELVLAVRK